MKTVMTPPFPSEPVHSCGDHTRALLAAGVPLTLLLDLMEPGGPDSAAILAAERAGTDPGADAPGG